jgi:hypothetical protein
MKFGMMIAAAIFAAAAPLAYAQEALPDDQAENAAAA